MIKPMTIKIQQGHENVFLLAGGCETYKCQLQPPMLDSVTALVSWYICL